MTSLLLLLSQFSQITWRNKNDITLLPNRLCCHHSSNSYSKCFFTRKSGGGNASSLGNCLISHSARYFVNIFARNNDITVTVTCHSLVKLLVGTKMISLFYQIDYAVTIHRILIPNVFLPGNPPTPASPWVDYILLSRTTIFYFL